MKQSQQAQQDQSRFGGLSQSLSSSSVSSSSKNKFLKSATHTPSTSVPTTMSTMDPITTNDAANTNTFFSLPSYLHLDLKNLEPEQQTDDCASNLPPSLAVTSIDDFPPLSSKSSNSTNARSKSNVLMYKNALVTTIGQRDYEDQARIRNAVQREVERKEERMRQLQLASRRERAVASLVGDRQNMPYEYDVYDDAADADNYNDTDGDTRHSRSTGYN
jgi:hypothetical protein